MKIQLTSGRLTADLDVSAAVTVHQAPSHAKSDALADALQHPLGLPPLPECVVPGDRVVIAIDPQTPAVTELIGQVWEQFQNSGVVDLDITLLLPGEDLDKGWKTLLENLPVHIRNQVAIHIHDPAEEQQRGYLASSASGTRIYLTHHLIDADLIVTIGIIGFDPLLGYRGTGSAIFPAFSDLESIRAARGSGHRELTPDDKRPLRDLVDEIGWLLGTQFFVQVVPDSAGQPGHVFCGAADPVMAAGQQCLKQQWQFAADEFLDLAVISVTGLTEQFGWKQLGAALAAVSHIVEDGGRIAVVADLPQPVGPALELLRRSNEVEDVLKPIRLEPPEDGIEVTQIIHALLRSGVCLYSNLNSALVEELGMLPLASAAELQRLLDSAERAAIIPAADYAWPQVVAQSRF